MKSDRAPTQNEITQAAEAALRQVVISGLEDKLWDRIPDWVPDTSMDGPATARVIFAFGNAAAAVIYPVSNDPDGFRGTTPNH
jgi:hypothetical protein